MDFLHDFRSANLYANFVNFHRHPSKLICKLFKRSSIAIQKIQSQSMKIPPKWKLKIYLNSTKISPPFTRLFDKFSPLPRESYSGCLFMNEILDIKNGEKLNVKNTMLVNKIIKLKISLASNDGVQRDHELNDEYIKSSVIVVPFLSMLTSSI